MGKKYLIAESAIIDGGNFVSVGDTREVGSTEFFELLDSKIKQVTEGTDRFEEIMNNVKLHLSTNSKGITIRDIFFQIKQVK